MPGTVPGAWDTAENKTDKNPCSHRALFCGQRTSNEPNKVNRTLDGGECHGEHSRKERRSRGMERGFQL